MTEMSPNFNDIFNSIFSWPHILMRPKVFKEDGRWVAVYGDVHGYGSSPHLACQNFDHNWLLQDTKSDGDNGIYIGLRRRDEKSMEAEAAADPAPRDPNRIRLLISIIIANTPSPGLAVLQRRIQYRLSYAGVTLSLVSDGIRWQDHRGGNLLDLSLPGDMDQMARELEKNLGIQCEFDIANPGEVQHRLKTRYLLKE